ncbi:redoxin domain-containing protein [Haloferula chungangensis]|uniref:thioredoxin-dependent peroxiredoxin n=1 Tax=Haloferula chungangensis TaxID=1048331 RepID=A0ABW2LAB0_9BACT
MFKRALPLLLIAGGSLNLVAQGLNEALDERKTDFLERAPAKLIESQSEALRELEDSGIYEKVLKVGDKAPDFTLGNQDGVERSLSKLLEKGPLVLTWYRGAWCPYCSITLSAMAERLGDFEELGATLVALTPELPEVTQATRTEKDLGFQVLTDLNHRVAEKFGLVFPLNAETAARYEENFKLVERSGEEAADRLPLPATYVISQDGVIRYVFADADYRRRAEPSRIVDSLRALKDGPTGIHLVQQFWENTWNPPYDLELIDRLMTEDFVITSAGSDVKGRAEFKEWVRKFQQKAQGLRLENREIFASAEGDRVVSRWIARARNGGVLGTEADGEPIEFTGIAIWEVRDGKLAHNWVERSALEMFQRIQAGE